MGSGLPMARRQRLQHRPHAAAIRGLPYLGLVRGCVGGEEQLASLAPSSGAARHLLPLRRRRALSGRYGRDLTEQPFSRCAGEGLIPNLAARDGEEALLPFTGEGARRADEGARAQRSVLLMLPGRARAARFASALIRRCAPPSPASQEKGCFRTVRQGPDG